MTTIGHARRLSRKALEHSPGSIRALIALELLIDTLLITALVLLSPPHGLFTAAVCFITLTSLVMQHPLANAARKSTGHTAQSLSPLRALALLPLALPAAGIAALLEWLFSRMMTDWTLAVQLLSGASILSICAAALIALAVSILLFGFVSVLTRQLALIITECPTPLSLVGSAFKTALRHAFAPLGMLFRSLGWFVLAFVLSLLAVAALCFVTTPITVNAGLTMLLLQLLAALFALPVWAWAAALLLGGFWMLGLGIIARSHWELSRLYWHRLIFKKSHPA